MRYFDMTNAVWRSASIKSPPRLYPLAIVILKKHYLHSAHDTFIHLLIIYFDFCRNFSSCT